MGINEAWKSTCTTLLRGDVGELEDYGEYLKRYNGISLREKESEVSGEKVVTASAEFCKDAKFISNEEIGGYSRIIGSASLDVNEIKDIDSIVEALSGKLYYAGNIRLGNFRDITESDRCSDSLYVHCSQMVYEGSRYVAYSNMVRKCEYGFGVSMAGESSCMVKAYNFWKCSRCFEIFRVFNSSDCYFGSNLEGCTECMFSFNLRNRRNMIGNLALPKEKYASLKAKLVGEIRETLGKKKDLDGIVDLVASGAEREPRTLGSREVYREENAPKEVEDAFATTTGVILGKRLGPLVSYGQYLSKHVGEVYAAKSIISGKLVLIPPYSCFLKMAGRMMSLEESLEYGKRGISESEVGGLTLENAPDKLREVKAFSPDVDLGTNIGLVECAVYGNDSAHSFRSFQVYKGKYSGYSQWPRNSEYAFGCFSTVLSRFTINCYNSFNLTRCFEVEGSYGCSDCYFCHNCEGLTDCMFCFNAKSLRYAIGNREIGREKYMEIKKRVLEEIVKGLVEEKDFPLDIYNAGCWKRGAGIEA